MSTFLPFGTLVAALACASIAVVAMVALRNRIIRHRMQLTLLAATAVVVLHLAARLGVLGGFAQAGGVATLLIAVAVINTAVTLLLNPWFVDRTPDRAPAIVQDALVIGLFLIVGLFVYDEDARLFTTSAIAAAVLGFALQETLGNAFAGLAIQVEKPFRVGHWITVGAYEGTVREVTWRATKIWTKNGNMVILPNSLVAREAINNYSEPLTPTRLHIDVGVGYQVPPNEARQALLTAMGQVPRVLRDPAPEALLWDFAPSSLSFRVFFWVDDYSVEEYARDEVRRAVYYELHRRQIEIPWPIQVEYAREERPVDLEARRSDYLGTIAAVPVFAGLSHDAHVALAGGAAERLFGAGETIVAEGGAASSMFIVRQGAVVVSVGANRREVALIEAGGYFGEMSLLTGEPRSATVSAREDCRVLEISGEAFGAYIRRHPDAVDALAAAATTRRRELDEVRAASAAPDDVRLTLADRIRRFFGLGH
jgi:small-conductance mechanosensitive channel/CRP-like cAMP-binding protein